MLENVFYCDSAEGRIPVLEADRITCERLADRLSIAKHKKGLVPLKARPGADHRIGIGNVVHPELAIQAAARADAFRKRNSRGGRATEGRQLCICHRRVPELYAADVPAGGLAVLISEDQDRLAQGKASIDGLSRVLLHTLTVDVTGVGAGDKIHRERQAVPLAIRNRATVITADTDPACRIDKPVTIVAVGLICLVETLPASCPEKSIGVVFAEGLRIHYVHDQGVLVDVGSTGIWTEPVREPEIGTLLKPAGLDEITVELLLLEIENGLKRRRGEVADELQVLGRRLE